MPVERPAVPRPLGRRVLIEAGHRCAIPTCRNTPVDLAHIEPWSKVRKHEFTNLIALCPTCHRRFDRGEIDRIAMRQYKANLALLTSRYGETERRVLGFFALHKERDTIHLPGGMDVLLAYLLHDGYLEHRETFRGRATPDGLAEFDIVVLQAYRLTEDGREFVRRWSKAAPLE